MFLRKHLLSYVRRSLYHTKTGVYGFRPTKPLPPAASRRLNVSELPAAQVISAFREHGHKGANIDPLELVNRTVPELNRALFAAKSSDAPLKISNLMNMSWKEESDIDELVDKLTEIYCGSIGIEFEHCATLEERLWLAEHFEATHGFSLDSTDKIRNAKLMKECEAFDIFLAKKFPTLKRYGAEGSESMVAFLDALLKESSTVNLKDVVMCIAHRGRLNLLACILNFPLDRLFHKLKGNLEFPLSTGASGDVISHLSISTELQYGDRSIGVTMIPNPSHLEANNPVAAGYVRALQQTNKDGHYGNGHPGDTAMCLQVHGDGSFVGQGVCAETFVLAKVPHFDIGGTIHLITNNQIAFTTEGDRGRSSMYASDLAHLNKCPVLHVNGEDLGAVVRAAQLAVGYRNVFRSDIIVDLISFRKWGHNEMDEPAFTQPLLYDAIRGRESFPDSFANSLTKEGLCTEADVSTEKFENDLLESHKRSDAYDPKPDSLQDWTTAVQRPSTSLSRWDTGVPLDLLRFVCSKSVEMPEEFSLHSVLERGHVSKRLEMIQSGKGLDWATAEALAVGSLIYQGYTVRLSGQDVGRGTFSHRHWMLTDQKTDEIFIPFNSLLNNQSGFLEIANSPLSELSIVGFEYGISVHSENLLPIWEAQFGDFFNGAQIMFDTFVSSGELKWLWQSGLVVLLPHGIDGAGPEHSSCRMERFLQLCDSSEDRVDTDAVNMEIVNPSTPSQYFHLLRRQMVRPWRKPLIVVAPKLHLRSPVATSDMNNFAPGTSFSPVIDNTDSSPLAVTTLVFCSGKHFYTLNKVRNESARNDIALIRMESLCPFPAAEISSVLSKYSKARNFVWAQEEHRNMGSWSFVSPRFNNLFGCSLRYAGRDVLGTPAVGTKQLHDLECKSIIDQVFNIK